MKHTITAAIRSAYTNHPKQKLGHSYKLMNKVPRVAGMNTNIRESFFNRPIGFL